MKFLANPISHICFKKKKKKKCLMPRTHSGKPTLLPVSLIRKSQRVTHSLSKQRALRCIHCLSGFLSQFETLRVELSVRLGSGPRGGVATALMRSLSLVPAPVSRPSSPGLCSRTSQKEARSSS